MKKPILVLAVAALAGASSLWAQTSRATLGGRVTDAQGSAVPNAEVSVVSEETDVKQITRTNEQGNWVVQFLIPARYNFTISAAGFKSIEHKGIVLQTSDNKQIDSQLEVGSTTTELTVTAEVPLIDTTAATSGTVISQDQILEMPSSSRVLTILATLSPGVLQQDQNNNTAHLWSHDAASQITVDGGRNNTRSNTFELNGMPNLKTGGQVGFMPAPDAIQEFRVVMNAYDSSIGRQAGGTIQMVTKSGSAKVHGSLYEFNQNNVFNANTFQSNLVGAAKAPIHFNEYGGTIGGPVWIPKVYNGKQKTFFFFAYDGTRNQDPRFGTRSVFTDLERKGDFSQSFTSTVTGGNRTRIPLQIFDPNTVVAGGARRSFPATWSGWSRPRRSAVSARRAGLRGAPRPRARRDLRRWASPGIPDRRGLHPLGQGERRSGGSRSRFRRGFARGVRPRHHRPRSDRARPAVRAFPQSGTRVDAGLRRRLLHGGPRPGHRLRADKYGRDRVSQIITYGTMAAKAVVRDVGRVLGSHLRVTSTRSRSSSLFELGMTSTRRSSRRTRAGRLYEGDDGRPGADRSRATLEGLSRNAGARGRRGHRAPVLTDFTPLYCEAGSTTPVTQLDKDDVEAVGLVKFDFLGLRTLTIIDWAVRDQCRASHSRRTAAGDRARCRWTTPPPMQLLEALPDHGGVPARIARHAGSHPPAATGPVRGHRRRWSRCSGLVRCSRAWSRISSRASTTSGATDRLPASDSSRFWSRPTA